MKKLLLMSFALLSSCVLLPHKVTVVGVRGDIGWKCIVESTQYPGCYVESYAESFERAVSNGQRQCERSCGTSCELKYCI